MREEANAVGEFVLGRPGVVAMTWFFAAGVGLTAVPYRLGRGWHHGLPGLLLALALVVPLGPYAVLTFLLSFGLSAALLFPATQLLNHPRQRALHWVLGALAVSIVGFSTGPLVPDWLEWAGILFAPFLMLGTPLAAVVLVAPILQRNSWLAPVASCLCFGLAFAVWTARDWLYRSAYQ